MKQILKRKDVILDIKIKDATKESLILYEKGKVVDYFMMVVQGHVDVTVGMEEFTFPQGEYLLCISCNCGKTSPIQARQTDRQSKERTRNAGKALTVLFATVLLFLHRDDTPG